MARARAGPGQPLSPPSHTGTPFPRNFLPAVRKILSRLFRVFVHVYIHHFDRIAHMGSEAHVNTCYKHFYYFVKEFGLIDTKELEPLVSGWVGRFFSGAWRLGPAYQAGLLSAACLMGMRGHVAQVPRCWGRHTPRAWEQPDLHVEHTVSLQRPGGLRPPRPHLPGLLLAWP